MLSLWGRYPSLDLLGQGSPRSGICGLGILPGLWGKALLPNSWVFGKGTSKVYMKTVPQILGSVA